MRFLDELDDVDAEGLRVLLLLLVLLLGLLRLVDEFEVLLTTERVDDDEGRLRADSRVLEDERTDDDDRDGVRLAVICERLRSLLLEARLLLLELVFPLRPRGLSGCDTDREDTDEPEGTRLVVAYVRLR